MYVSVLRGRLLVSLVAMVAGGSFAAPAVAELRLEWINPKDTDPRIDDWLEPHYVGFDPGGQVKGKLFVHFPGSRATPSLYTLIIQTAASEGYHAIGLRYPNSWSVNFDLCQDSPDRDCHEKVRLEILDGTDRSPLIDVDRVNCIENRLIKLLLHLEALHPGEGWSEFLDGDGLRWSRILFGGHSQGGGHAAMIAKYHVVSRVLLFAGGPDFSRYYGALAPWHQGHVSRTIDYYGFVHVEDALPTHLAVWKIFGMDAFGPPRDVADTPPPYAFTHQILTSLPPGEPNEFHNSVVVDMHTPKDPNGVPIYLPVWKYMLTSPYPEGDVNCDGAVNFGDINPFVLALGDPQEYARRYPACTRFQADVTGDGKVDFGDINTFVRLLGGL